MTETILSMMRTSALQQPSQPLRSECRLRLLRVLSTSLRTLPTWLTTTQVKSRRSARHRRANLRLRHPGLERQLQVRPQGQIEHFGALKTILHSRQITQRQHRLQNALKSRHQLLRSVRQPHPRQASHQNKRRVV